eukprot:731929-Rhodomonas_salina.1
MSGDGAAQRVQPCGPGAANGQDTASARADPGVSWAGAGTFDLEFYEYCDHPSMADLHVIVPGKFVAMKGPHSKSYFKTSDSRDRGRATETETETEGAGCAGAARRGSKGEGEGEGEREGERGEERQHDSRLCPPPLLSSPPLFLLPASSAGAATASGSLERGTEPNRAQQRERVRETERQRDRETERHKEQRWMTFMADGGWRV